MGSIRTGKDVRKGTKSRAIMKSYLGRGLIKMVVNGISKIMRQMKVGVVS